MRKKYKELHAEKTKLERLEVLASIANILDLIRIAAKNSTSFEEFTAILEATIQKVEEKMDE